MEQVCPVCGGVGSEPFAVKLDLPLRQCKNCSFVYLGQTRDLSGYFNKVEAEFFSDGYLRRRDLFSEQFLINKARRRMRVIQRFKNFGRLLDIGCGTGELIYVANKLGYQAEGLEYSQSLVEYVRAKYHATVHCGDVGMVNLPNKYDIITMSHVLEHVIDPLATLQDVSKLLNPGGILYLAVPNIDCYEARFRGWGSYEDYHLWYFSPNTLKHFLEKVGAQVIYIHTWEPYSAWLNTMIRGLMPRQHAAARMAIHKDRKGQLRYLFLGAMGLINVLRFISGFLLTPLRKMQEVTLKGEELIVVANWRNEE
jgi:2-polyprenyl-3-methyl-5-hydroxy-6-metoxy-1,4-benzoquinol methylase